MARWDNGLLSDEQAEVVLRHLPEPVLEEDLSWGLISTRVLRVRSGRDTVIVKTGDPGNHHIAREIDAHVRATEPLVSRGRAARLRVADRAANVVVLDYLEGKEVDGTDAELDPDLHRQAGELARLLHREDHRPDDAYEARATQKALAWLERQHRIAPEVEAEAKARLAEYRPGSVDLVPTHGDWHPRNWLVADGRLLAIDFGRFDYRPASSDLTRLAVKQWRARPELEEAFLEGYGQDPRAELPWRMALLREAIGTAVWAFLVGDQDFEDEGHRNLAEALASF